MATILIVDDEDQVLNLLQLILQCAGHHTLLASDGAQGLAIIGSSKPDVVILDDMLPDISGSEVCSQVKHNPLTRDIRVVMYSAGHRIRNQSHLTSIGADAALFKPSSSRELLQTVSQLLAIQQ